METEQMNLNLTVLFLEGFRREESRFPSKQTQNTTKNTIADN